MDRPEPHPSAWQATGPKTDFPPLDADLEVDVAIVGGGITGITAAARLIEDGRQVAVIEQSAVGAGETGHTTAHLTEIVDTRYSTIASDFGEAGARAVAAASRASIDEIERLIRQYGLSCGFARVPAYLYTERERDRSMLQDEVEAARRAGVAAEFTEQVPLPFPTAGALRVPGQAQFHPLEYLRPLAMRLAERGVRIFEGTTMRALEEGDRCRVETDRGVVTARHVIVAANVPVNDRLIMFTRLPAYRTYAIACRVPPGRVPAALFWDTDDPYHYTRVQQIGNDTLLIVGGEDHKTGHETDTDARYSALEQYARARFDASVPAFSWSGQVIEPVDGLPYIGRNPLSSANVWIATAYSGNGMTFGTVAAMILTDLVAGRADPWAELFSPGRWKPLASAVDFVKENVDFPKAFVLDRLTNLTADDGTPADVEPGEGRVLVVAREKYAVCRDRRGGLHVLSPVCTHMGCDVRWNSAEQSWDCPCHGSRFDQEGRVLNGPAVKELERRELPPG